MIKYCLKCKDCSSEFDSWFSSSKEFDRLKKLRFLNCEECGSLIDESKKQWMVKNGERIAIQPSLNTAGFHISELYSVWSTWGEMATAFLEAKKQPEMLKTWINTALGETWEEQGDGVEYETLLERRLNFDETTIPEDVLILVAGVDTQKDRLELLLVGFGKS